MQFNASQSIYNQSLHGLIQLLTQHWILERCRGVKVACIDDLIVYISSSSKTYSSSSSAGVPNSPQSNTVELVRRSNWFSPFRSWGLRSRDWFPNLGDNFGYARGVFFSECAQWELVLSLLLSCRPAVILFFSPAQARSIVEERKAQPSQGTRYATPVLHIMVPSHMYSSAKHHLNC